MKVNLIKIVFIVAITLTIAINLLADIIPINGLSTKYISDSFNVYFVPAGFTFAIWGFIYLGLILLGLYQLKSNQYNKLFKKLLLAFLIGCIANSAWIILWHYLQINISIIVMVILLISLIVNYRQIENDKIKKDNLFNLCIKLPISLYLGWITVATIANATVVLFNIGFTGSPIPPQIWSTLLIVIAGILGSLFILNKRDIIYSIVILWSTFGIAYKFSSEISIVSGVIITWIMILFSILIIFYKDKILNKR